MDLKAFSEANQIRNEECFPQCKDWDAEDWLLAFIGELGEACNIKKKVNRGDLTLEQAKPELQMELGDAFCYFDHFIRACGSSMEDAVIDAYNKVSDRKSYPLKLNPNYGKNSDISSSPKPEPTHYVHCNAGNALFVKEAGFFKEQGGLEKEWGKHWTPVVAESIGDARRQAAKMFNVKLSHIHYGEK